MVVGVVGSFKLLPVRVSWLNSLFEIFLTFLIFLSNYAHVRRYSMVYTQFAWCTCLHAGSSLFVLL